MGKRQEEMFGFKAVKGCIQVQRKRRCRCDKGVDSTLSGCTTSIAPPSPLGRLSEGSTAVSPNQRLARSWLFFLRLKSTHVVLGSARKE